MHKVYIVRHGETECNTLKIIQGQMDTEMAQLNELGMLQAKKTGQALKDVPFDVCYSSDLGRATKTSQMVLEGRSSTATTLNEVDLHLTKELRERHLGDLQGLSYSVYKMGTQESHSPDFETREQTKARIQTWWDATIPQLLSTANLPQTILIVSHGAALTGLFNHLVNSHIVDCAEDVYFFVGIPIHNTSISIIEMNNDGTKGVLKQFADVKHLSDALDEDDNTDSSVA